MILFFVVYKTKVIKMRNAMWVGGGITGMGEIPMLGVKEKGIAKVIRDIFRNGEKGFFYDPSDLTTVYQDSAGTAAVTPIGQPVGLMLDKGRGLALGENKAKVTSINGVQIGGPALTSYVVADSLVKGRLYKVRFTITGYSGTGNLGLSGTSQDAFFMTPSNIRLKSENTVVEFNAVAGSTFQSMATRETNTANFENIQIREVLGNYAYQTTSAARPILKQAPILGVNILPNLDFTKWSPIGSATTTTKAFTVIDSAGGIRLENLFEIGKTYKITAKLATTATTALLVNASNGATPLIATATGGTVDITYTATNSTLYLRTGTGTTTVDELVIKEVKGYRTNQNYINYDGVDDKLITDLPTPINNATVLRAVPGVGTVVKYNQTLPMSYEDTANHSGLIAIDRALTRSEQLRLMTELDKKAGATSLDTLTFKAFDNNQEGFVYDPNDLSTMYQDAAGTVPVTGVGQAVGLMLDKSKGVALGTNAALVSKLTGQGVGGLDFKTVHVSGALEKGSWYKVTINVSNYSGTGDVGITGTNTAFPSPNIPTATRSRSSNGLISFIALAQTSNTVVLYTRSSNNADFTDITIQKISGNHAYQTTSASRPILRQNAVTGANYLEFDGVDDYLEVANLALPAPFTATFAIDRSVLSRAVIFSAGASGYFLSDGDRAGAYDNPTKPLHKVPKDVITYKVTSSPQSQIEIQTGKDGGALLQYNSFAPNGVKYIGRFNPTGSAKFNGNFYGMFVITKVMSTSEDNELRAHFNKRMGI